MVRSGRIRKKKKKNPLASGYVICNEAVTRRPSPLLLPLRRVRAFPSSSTAAASGAPLQAARASPDELECGRASRRTKSHQPSALLNPRVWPRCVFSSSPWQLTLEFALNMSNIACGQKPQVRISSWFFCTVVVDVLTKSANQCVVIYGEIPPLSF